MYKANVLTSWSVNSTAENIPTLCATYQCESGRLANSGEVIPEPNLAVWEIACSQTTLDAIEADPNYWVESADEIVEDEL